MMHKTDNNLLVDTAFLNAIQQKMPTGCEMKHLGFGDFALVTPKGRVTFTRGAKDFEGQSGRSHFVAGDASAIRADARARGGMLMKRYRVRVRIRQTMTYEVEVEANDARIAEEAAGAAPAPDAHTVTEVTETNVLEQLGEPWVYGWSGEDTSNTYLGRPDQYLETEDLLVFRCPVGRVFTDSDVDTLRRRAEAVVGPVKEHWNGAGCGSLSIKMVDKFKKLDFSQVESLMARRQT